MDRIIRALDRAGARVHDHRFDPQGERRIVYTQTQQCELDPGTLRQGRIIGELKDHRVTDCYRLLRTRVLHRMRQNHWRTLGLTSAGPQEGKTLTAINLALSIALEPQYTVLLVDADLRRPNIHSVFGFHPQWGLADYLVEGTPVEDVLVNPRVERLVLMPGRRARGATSEHLAAPRMQRLVDELKARYADRIVIFDLPPVLVGDDVVALAPKLDALLLVAEEGETQSDELEAALRLLEGTEIVGMVLNKSQEKTRGYDYYY